VIIAHLGKTPRIAASAYVAPNAVVCGDVTVGENCRIMFGAQVIAEGGSITIGDECIVMENAVLRVDGVVHLKTFLPSNATVPIGWVAVGDPRRSCRLIGTTGSGKSRSP
jgi:carbonic anhydrase/acetyltransferase-like protein (isoleucine patch superfamily)